MSTANHPKKSSQDLSLSPLLTPEQVADLLGIPFRRLYAWRAEGKGPKYVKVGHNLRYRESDIHEYIQQNSIGPGTE